MPLIVPVEKAVLITLKAEDYEEYTDGIFITSQGWNVVETNMSRLKTECDLLRAELSKFED